MSRWRPTALLLLGVGHAACAPRPTANLGNVETQAPEVSATELTADTALEPASSRWVDISVESAFGCAVERTGSVFCWGRGPSAEMELRELPEQPPPNPTIYGASKWGPASRVELVHDARRVSTASSRACAIVEDGRVRCWGAVRWGSQHVYDVAGITGAIDLEIGDGESCALLEGGELWCWGTTDYGIPRLRLVEAISVTVGDNLACGLTKTGDVICFGQAIADWHRYDTQFKQQRQAAQPGTAAPKLDEQDFPDTIDVGRFHGAVDVAISGWNLLCVLRSDGQVVCSSQDVSSLLRDEKLDMREVVGASGLVEISTTRTHACGRTTDDRASCWGRNVYGQLGDGDSVSRESAAPVEGLEGVLDVSVTEDFSCALTRADRIACWGFDRGEALGREDTHVHTLDGLRASSLTASARTSCAVDQHGKLRCWGSDMLDQAGIAAVATPHGITLPGPGQVVSLSAGWEGCILLSSGALYCGNWTASGTLDFAVSQTITDVAAYTAGPSPVCAIIGASTGPRSKARLHCGQSYTQLEEDRQLGDPSEVSTANMRGCVIHGRGKVSCFGELYYWNGQPPPARAFERIEGIRDARAITSSNYHDCALLRSGHVSCWVGRTETTWSADGRTPRAIHYRPSPTKDIGLDNAIGLVAGTQHHCALLADGTVRCWADNPYAETTEWTAVPEHDGDIAELAAGSEHTCARTTAGVVTCWGDDVWGQLGRVPTRVYLEPATLPID